MKAVFYYSFHRLIFLTLLVFPLSGTQALLAQTFNEKPSYRAAGFRPLIKAQPNSALVRVRYESNNPGPVHIELLDDRGRVVYTERKQETHFVGNYDLAPLPAGDYALHLFTYGFHHVEVLRISRDNNSIATVQVIRPTAFRTSFHALFLFTLTN